MAEYIDREATLKRFEEIKQSGISLKDAIYIDGVMAVIETLPAADVAPVRHGRWIGKRLDNFKKYQVKKKGVYPFSKMKFVAILKVLYINILKSRP